MAREVIIRIKDDLDPTLMADKTIEFSAHGTQYEMDLTAEHADQFDADMQRWIKAARIVVPVPSSRAAKTKRSKPDRHRYQTPEQQAAFDQRTRVRVWARDTGYRISDHGEIARDIVTAYAKTHPDEPILAAVWPTGGHTRRKAKRSAPESVVAQDGSEQTAMELLTRDADARSEGGRKAAALSRQRALESGRFGLPDELRAKIRAWAIKQAPELGQGVKGQLKTDVVYAYFAAHPDEKPAR